ncbi:hypothetical protein GUJ93_ZPchr0013g34117 [Zizania palustris]|uniref:Uncharacterized protein n=1 Tax=Zizania palustris TaxID=103762 RepID=A0A8J5WSL6_ZIZPA|nr:hypothetical protein GUJ93_ZPchr0013g34117 [Zizania palustris]
MSAYMFALLDHNCEDTTIKFALWLISHVISLYIVFVVMDVREDFLMTTNDLNLAEQYSTLLDDGAAGTDALSDVTIDSTPQRDIGGNGDGTDSDDVNSGNDNGSNDINDDTSSDDEDCDGTDCDDDDSDIHSGNSAWAIAIVAVMLVAASCHWTAVTRATHGDASATHGASPQAAHGASLDSDRHYPSS